MAASTLQLQTDKAVLEKIFAVFIGANVRSVEKGGVIQTITQSDEIRQEFSVRDSSINAAIPIYEPHQMETKCVQFIKDYCGDLDQNEWFYGQFTGLWGYYLRNRMMSNARAIWEIALDYTKKAETGTVPNVIHKGTPYYFYAGSCIFGEEIEKGLLLMHMAVEEDKRTFGVPNYRTAPAYAFVSFNYSKGDQFFRARLVDLLGILTPHIDEYNRIPGIPNLDLATFKTKFLERSQDMEDPIFIFVYTLLRLRYMRDAIKPEWTKTEFGSLWELQILSDICILTDDALAKMHGFRIKPDGTPKLFSDKIMDLTSHYSIIRLDRIMLKQINESFRQDYSLAISSLVQNSFRFGSGATTTSPTSIQRDFSLTYGIRNFTAHDVGHCDAVYENFPTILQSIMNAFFFTIATAP